MRFPAEGFNTVSTSEVLEEERFDDFKSGRYYPFNIGDIYSSKYQVIGKLGFGVASTVWLARDLQEHRYVTLKVHVRERVEPREFKTYEDLAKGSRYHPGYPHVRTALDTFTISRHRGDHHCLGQKPMWDSFRDLLERNAAHRFTESLLKAGLMQLFLALDYLHTECKLVHTDIKADNILQEMEDETILIAFTNAELEEPSPRKCINGVPVYASRRFERPKIYGLAVLGDFGAAVRGDEGRDHDAQPDVNRSPEVMLKIKWSYPTDVWNVGAMIWDLFEGKHMFNSNDPDGKGYSTRAHLAEVIGMLGHPPLDFLKRGKRSQEFFTVDGKWKADVKIPQNMSLEHSENYLEGKNKVMFLDLMRGMLQWRPEDRKTARQLLEDPWLTRL